jgi:LuxR family transcriptional regulator, maltose regulon positive regulatory protein
LQQYFSDLHRRIKVSDILLTTKIRTPPLRRNFVNRPNLIQRLNAGLAQNSRLILVSAPAGYGKSTLLSEWVSQVNFPTAWLSLEKGENIPARFWSYFFRSLSSIPHLRRAGIGEAIFQALQSPQPPPLEPLLANLVNDLSTLEEEAILVLDDLHTITEGKIHEDLVFLMDHLQLSTNSLHLVVASRMDPPWPLARWRVRQEVTELRSTDLRFTLQETAVFLNDVMSLNLSTESISLLDARTEGWITGLQMAALSMQGRDDMTAFIRSFSGSHRFVLDYLVEEVLDRQPAEIQEFLLKTSILDRLTASLCEAVTGKKDCQTVLTQLERANLFLVPLDDERRWYRYHHLFAELLLKRLKQNQPDHIVELHQRACKWYSENSFLSEAIDHALDAGDILRVNEFVSGNALAMVEHFELLDVLRHFEEIPEQQFLSKPWLCVAYAWVKAYVEPSGEIDQIFLKAMQSISEIDDALEKQHLTSHLDAVWAYVAWVKGKAELALEFTRTAYKTLAEDDWMTRAHLLNIEGLALQYLDNLPGATQSFEAAIIAGQRSGRLQETFFAYTSLAFVYYLQGKLRLAFSLCQHVLNLAQEHSTGDESGQVLSRMPILAHAYANMSLLQVEWNDVEEALSNARNGVTLAEQWKQADALHFSLTCLSKALGAAGVLAEAFAVNQRAMQLALNVSPWFKRLSIYNEVWLYLIKGDIHSAVDLFPEVESLIEEEWKHGGNYLILKVSLLYAQKDYPGVLAALEGLMEGFEQTGKYWTLINLLPFQALALQALGQEEEALRVIGHCLALAEPEGFVRTFVERGGPMFELLQAAKSQSLHTEYIESLLPAFDISGLLQKPMPLLHLKTRSKYQGVDLLEPLSERELEVLRCLNSPLSIVGISQELYVAPSTIRTHVHNIYSKLNVHNRIEAIQKAKDLSLV